MAFLKSSHVICKSPHSDHQKSQVTEDYGPQDHRIKFLHLKK